MLGLVGDKEMLRVSDSFSRADSAVTPGSADTGQAYTAVAGTWGISSGKLYSVTDAQSDVVIIQAGIGNGVIEADISGDFTAANYRYLHLLFRYVDSTNYLICLLGADSSFALWKVVDGVFTKLVEDISAAGVDGQVYRFVIALDGPVLAATLDGGRGISYTLIGAEATLFHPGITTMGVRLNRSGAPNTVSRLDNLTVRR